MKNLVAVAIANYIDSVALQLSNTKQKKKPNYKSIFSNTECATLLLTISCAIRGMNWERVYTDAETVNAISAYMINEARMIVRGNSCSITDNRYDWINKVSQAIEDGDWLPFKQHDETPAFVKIENKRSQSTIEIESCFDNQMARFTHKDKNDELNFTFLVEVDKLKEFMTQLSKK